MAYNVSQNYKKVIYSGNAKHKLKISFGGVELENADMYCEKITRKSRIIPNGSKGFYLDKFVGQELECIFHELDITKIVNPVNVFIGTLVNNAYEYVPLGIFNIQDKPVTDKNKVTIKLLDNSVKFDFNYDGKPLIEQNGGKATKGQIFNDICSKAGVTTKVTNFDGFNDEIGTYDNTIKARKYISYFAEQSGAIATIDRDGELIFVYLNNLVTHKIPLEIVESYEKGESFKISRIVYEDGVRKFFNGNETNDTLFLDTANPYINSQEQVNKIFNIVSNFEIDSLKTGKIYGNPAIDGYDLIEICEKSYNLAKINKEFTFGFRYKSLDRIVKANENIIISYDNIIKTNSNYKPSIELLDNHDMPFFKIYLKEQGERVKIKLNKDLYSFILSTDYNNEDAPDKTTINSLMIYIGNDYKPYKPYGEKIISKTLATNNLVYNGVITTNYETQIEVGDKQENTSFKDTPATLKKYVNSQIDQVNGTIKLQSGKIEDNKSKINTLELSSSATNSKITTIEKNVTQTNDKIDGVSASFNDFKDNEYMQTITGIQDQLDGAVQFWNGSEIPTLNNYPANEWKTESERNKHRADIYTITKDVDGVLKQGKGYRFDKFNNEWQWIELTDNELSAVQKLAQDALDKANANSKEITTIKEKTTELTQTDNQIKASVKTLETTIVDNKTTIDNKIAELIVKDNEISSEVKNVSSASQNNYQELSTKFDGYTPKSDTAELEKSVKQMQTDTYTKTEINTKLIDGSVTKVQTTSGTFDEDGMHYEKTNAPTKSTINEIGVSVDDSISDRELLFAGYDKQIKQTIVRTENLTVRKYFVCGDHTRIEKYGKGGGLFTL